MEARQEGQVLDGLGWMGVAQMQHRIVAAVPWEEDVDGSLVGARIGWVEISIV